VEMLPIYELQVDGAPVDGTVQYGSIVQFYSNYGDVNLIWTADRVVKGIHPYRCTVETAGNWAVYIFEDTEAWTRYDFAAADEVLTFTVEAPAYSLSGYAAQGNIVSVVCSAEIPFYCSWYYGVEKMYDAADAYLTYPGDWTVYVFASEEDQMSGDFTRAIEQISLYATEAEILPPEEAPTFSLVRINGIELPDAVSTGQIAKVTCSDADFRGYYVAYRDGIIVSGGVAPSISFHTAGNWTVYVFNSWDEYDILGMEAALWSREIFVY